MRVARVSEITTFGKKDPEATLTYARNRQVCHCFDGGTMRSGLRGAIVLMTQNFDPTVNGWIKCSFLKFSQLRDVVHRIWAPYLFEM